MMNIFRGSSFFFVPGRTSYFDLKNPALALQDRSPLPNAGETHLTHTTLS